MEEKLAKLQVYFPNHVLSLRDGAIWAGDVPTRTKWEVLTPHSEIEELHNLPEGSLESILISQIVEFIEFSLLMHHKKNSTQSTTDFLGREPSEAALKQFNLFNKD